MKQSNSDFSRRLEGRTRAFANKTIKLSRSLPKCIETDVIRRQITKSATSIGANYREANMSRSRADFKNKIKICQGESNETNYWLKIIRDQDWTEGKDVEDLIKESAEMIALFTSISNKLK